MLTLVINVTPTTYSVLTNQNASPAIFQCVLNVKSNQLSIQQANLWNTSLVQNAKASMFLSNGSSGLMFLKKLTLMNQFTSTELFVNQKIIAKSKKMVYV